MTFASGYRGSVNGSVQAAYTDQPGIGVPGMLAFASDLNNADSFFVGETDGIPAGAAVVLGAMTDASVAAGMQMPTEVAELPSAGKLDADFEGFMVFEENMQSDENGVPGWANGRVGRVVRRGRAGGRIYVKVVEAVDHTTDDVYMVTTAGATFALGDLATGAVPEVGGVAVQLTNVKWATSAAAGELAMVQLG